MVRFHLKVWIVASVALAGLNKVSICEEPAATADRPTAGDMVRTVIQAENKVHEVQRLLIRTTGTWTKTPRGVEATRREIQKQTGSSEIPANRQVELEPKHTECEELVFDGSRIRTMHESAGRSRYIQVWNGSVAKTREQYFPFNQDGCALSPACQFFRSVPCLGWLQVGQHNFWWCKDRPAWFGFGPPENYRLVGRERFRGHECFVLRAVQGFAQLRIGVDDRRLHGLVRFVVNSPGNPTAIHDAAVQQATGEPISLREWPKWLERQTESGRKQAEEKYYDYLFAKARPQFENYFEDYREVSPGWWIPWSYGYTIFNTDGHESFAVDNRDIAIAEFQINPKLSDEMFDLDFPEGVRLSDYRYDPPMVYPYLRDRSENEMRKLVAKRDAELATSKEILRKQDERIKEHIGKPAPEFPNSRWFNGSQLTWADLAGKVVVLDFFAEWCGPCRRDLPLLNELHAQCDSSGVVVIGVHAPGSEPDVIADFLKKFEVKYPVFLDTEKGAGQEGFGRIGSWYGVRALPHSVLVDSQGRVAGHGTLSEVLIQSRRLVEAKSSR